MAEIAPQVVVLAGPNGAGKSTSSSAVVRGVLGITEFVNADDIARGLSGFNVEGAALSAGRIMLDRVKELAQRRGDFAFETTLASRSFAPWIRELRQTGYLFRLIYLWLPSPEYAMARVMERVRRGATTYHRKQFGAAISPGCATFSSFTSPSPTHGFASTTETASIPSRLLPGVVQ